MTTDTIHGIERSPDSSAFGELVVPISYLWRRPPPLIEDMDVNNLTGALKHGDSVRVARSKIIDGRKWCYVKAGVEHEGEMYTQKGWLRASLLKDAGEVEYG